jgi:ACT-domain-containing protein, predicted allosteric regulator of homoserine dehydrogenase
VKRVNHKKTSRVSLGMRYSLTFALPDTPGQLLRVLEPIAKMGGNIVSIIHERDRVGDVYVPVSVVAEFPDTLLISVVLDELRKMGAEVLEVKEVFRKSSLTVMIIGDASISEFFDYLDTLSVSRMEVSGSSSKQRCVKVDLEASEREVGNLLKRLEEMCDNHGFTLLKPIL